MKKIILTLLLLLFCNIAVAQHKVVISYEDLPIPSSYLETEGIPDDPVLKSLTWHKWDTDNFIILSLDQNQGVYLAENIELIKKWVLTRWGLPNINFSTKCKILCVPNKELLEKLFRLENSYGEVRRDASNNITLSAVWMVLDNSPAEIVPSSITTICLNELQQKYNLSLNLWLDRGMSVLNSTLPQIRYVLSTPENVKEIYFTEKLLNTTQDEYLQFAPERKQIFDRECATLCLLLRKEFGQRNFVNFIKKGATETDLDKIYGFRNYNELDNSFSRYFTNISKDINSNKTPDDYLKINKVD